MNTRLQGHYFPSVAYMAALVQSDHFLIDGEEYFEKQTYRNRCHILGPNGPQSLVIPVNGRNTRQRMKDVRISYGEPWVRVHLNAIQTAYRSAPFYEYLDREIEGLFLQRPAFLLDLNVKILEVFLKKLKVNDHVTIASSYDLRDNETDLRNAFSPKREPGIHFPAYTQVFSNKFAFSPNLSVLDLLMNDLLKAREYLTAVKLL